MNALRVSASLLIAGASFSGLPSKSGDILISGKCVIPEKSAAYTKCAVLNDGRYIIALAGKTQDMATKILISDVILSGRLSPDFEKASPSLKQLIARSLSEIGTRLGDAQNSTNVRALQYYNKGSIETLIFVANRDQQSLDKISLLIPESRRSDLVPPSSLSSDYIQVLLESFQREFERVQALYNYLMFEEGDRVLDAVRIQSRLFMNRYASREGAEQINTLLSNQIAQLDALRSYKSYEREIEEKEAERAYDQVQLRRAQQERERREHAYRMAVQYTKAAQASALKWYSFWMGRPSSTIYIFR